DLKKIIKYSVHFKEFFLNQDAIQSGLLRKEITLLFKSIVDFKIYSKKRLIIDNESFRKIFKEDAIDLLASLLERLDSKNKEDLFKEAYHAKCFSDDDQAEDLFCEILSTVDHDLYHATVHEKTSCESFLFACEPFIRLMFGSRSESFEKKAVSNENPLISPSEPIRVDKPHCA
ncbi:hypothetical protein EBS02_05205, partial [bacterium]|nr:hypothetical protein [bacterium]